MTPKENISKGRRKRIEGRKAALAYFVPIVILVVILDQCSKYVVRQNLVLGKSAEFIPGIFDFQLVYNKGAAFGMMQNATLYFVAMALIMVIAVVLYLSFTKQHSRFELVSLSLIAAGAIGNALDRVFMQGTVTDFIATAFIDFPVFNVADISITVGCALFVFAFVFIYKAPENDTTSVSESGEQEKLQTNDGDE